MHVPFVVCDVLHVEALKLIIYSSGQSMLWDQRAIAYLLLFNPKKCCHAMVRSYVLQQAIVLIAFPRSWL